MKINDVIVKEFSWTDPFGRGKDIRQQQQNAAWQQFYANQNIGGPPEGEAPQRTTTNKKTTTAAKSDPAVMARQKELIAAGAKIKADGIMGPATRAAEKQFGGAVDAAKGSQTPGTATTITNPAQANQNAPATAPATAQPSADKTISSTDAAVRAGQNIGGQVAATQASQNATADFQKLAGITPTVSQTQSQPQSRSLPPGLASATTPQGASTTSEPTAAVNTQGDGQSAQPAASSMPNPWDGKDPAKAAAWAALSPEDQKWIGKADPTDKFILARSPSKGGVAGSLTPNFMKKESSPEQALENSDIALLRKLSGLL